MRAFAGLILLLALSTFWLSTSAHAGTDTSTKRGFLALGILTTFNAEHNYIKTELVKLHFDDKVTCEKITSHESRSREFIGKGGTNEKVPRIDWNFDGECWDLDEEDRLAAEASTPKR